VEDNPFFFYVGEEILAFAEAVVYLAYTVVDYACGGFYGLVADDEIIDTALIGVVLCGFFESGQDEDIEIGYIFVCDMAFDVGIFDPIASCIASEQMT